MLLRSTKTLFAATWLLAGGLGMSLADEVVLQDGTHLEGTVSIETPAKLILTQSGRNRVIDRRDIASVVKSDRTPATTDPAGVAPPQPEAKPVVPFWPPVENQPYPDLMLRDYRGRLVKLSSFRGKVVVLETVAMSCEGCQQMAGAAACGAFGNGSRPRGDTKSFAEYFPSYAGGLELSDPRLVYVQLILYDLSLHAPSVDSLKAWTQHFHLANRPNAYVLAGTPEMLGPASYAMIPGFQLIDRNFVLRSWFEGDTGKGDLYRDLLPMVPKLVAP